MVSKHLQSAADFPLPSACSGRQRKHFAFVPSTLLQRQKKVPQPVGPPEPTHCLQPLDLFHAQIKAARLGVIEEQRQSDWLSSALMVLVMNFYSLSVLKAYFPFFPSSLFHLCDHTGDVNPAERVLKTLLIFDTSTSTSDFKESLRDVSSCKAKGTPFQSSPPVPKHFQIPTLPAEAFLLQKATCLSLYLRVTSCASASRVADGTAPVPSKASKPLLPATQADATSVLQGGI